MKNNKISIIGIGKLGLCLGLNLSKSGWEITGMDIREEYLNSLKDKSFKSSEEYVEEYIQKYDISYTNSIGDCLINDIIFIVVPTPSTEDFKYDHSIIDSICEEIIKYGRQEKRKDLIINSTTFPGYCDELHYRLNGYNYFVSYNPEFISQGTIIKDQIYCDNVLIGESDKYSGDLIENIYKSFVLSNPVYNRLTRTEAEITKISVNCFLTTKISYANMIFDISNRYGCDGDKILNAVSTDSRIGEKYIKSGYGYGGPCFPRDNKALAKCAEEVGIKATIPLATDEMNKLHLEYQIEDFIKKNPDKSIPVEIDHITYKKESTLIEESQQLKFAISLKNIGYNIVIKDQREEVLNQIRDLFDIP